MEERTDHTIPEIEIRPARREDLERITDIYNQAVLRTTATFDTEEKSVPAMEAWFDDHGEHHPVLVASAVGAEGQEEKVVGWASLSQWSDRKAYDGTAEISLYVDEPARGRGVGRKLFERALEAARASDLHTVISRVAGDNEASIRLHRRFGFDQIGIMREVGLKFGRLLDVHLYQLILDK